MMITHESEEVVICGYCNEIVASDCVWDGRHYAHAGCSLMAEKRRDKAMDYMAEVKQYRMEKEGE